MSMSPHHRAISPPTPAPSPQPDLHRIANHVVAASTSASTATAFAVSDSTDPSQLLKRLSSALPQMTQSARLKVISELVDMLDMRELAHLSALVTPRLKVDFLSALPIEVSLSILSFIDDPKTLARASCVSRFWRSLVNDEHTWKVMCLKHKYRRRASSIAASDRFLRAMNSPRHSPMARLSPRVLRRTSIRSPITALQEINQTDNNDDDDAAVLASLYQRYRDRGLDPSNALHELRTLHDLFLSKQEGSAGSLSDQMSETEQTFYAQLEEIVEEESLARYGDQAAATSTVEVDMLSSSISPSSNVGQLPPPAAVSSPVESTSQPSNLGWLSAGPSTMPHLPRFMPTTAAISSGIRTADGRLDRLHGWQDTPPAPAFTPRTATLGLQISGGHVNNLDVAMDMDHADDLADPATVSQQTRDPGQAQPTDAPLLAPLPYYDSPTSRLSGVSASATRRETRRTAQDSLVPGPSMRRTSALREREAEQDPLPILARISRSHHDAEADAETKKARRSSAPLTESTTGSIGHEHTSVFSSHPLEKAVTTSGIDKSSSKLPFSYRTHFKMAYLTESNWRKGGRLQTQHISADAGHVVTSLAIDSEWIVVGMANSKIHVFSAETGLYAHTLLGHDAGVWCLTLISRTAKNKKPTLASADAESGPPPGKGKMVITDPEDGSGGKPYQAAADGDLRLVHHDPRPDAADVLLSPTSLALELDEELNGVSASIASTSSGSTSRQFDGNDETLEWFHKARRAMLRQTGPRKTIDGLRSGSNTDGYGSGHGDSDADLSIRSDGPSEGAARVSRSDATQAERRSRAKARAIAEAEAGSIRDAIMSDGTGQVPAHLAESIRRNGEAADGGAKGKRSAPQAMPRMSGNGLGLGNPCGSVLGYGNEDAIVVSGGCDRDVRVWDLKTGECKHVLHGHTSTVRCLKVLDGKPIAVSGSRDSTLRVWNVETGEHLHLLAGHHHSVRCIEVAGNKVASGSYDGACRIWDLDTGRCLHTLRGHIHYIYAVAFDGQKVATGSLDSTVRVWSAETGECLALFQGHTSLVGQLQLLDNTLVTGGSDGRVIVFSLKTYECLHRLCAHDNSVTCLQFDDRYIITGGNDGRVKLWDFPTGKFIRELCEPCDQVWKVSYRDDKVVVLCKRAEKTCMDVITFRPAADEM